MWWVGLPGSVFLVGAGFYFGEWWKGALLGLFFGTCFYWFLFPDRGALKAFRRSPSHEQVHEILLSDAGVSSRLPLSETTERWAVYRRARAFHDGILLYQDGGNFHWLADATLTLGTRSEAEELLRSKVDDFAAARQG
jgi:hypothetical protein